MCTHKMLPSLLIKSRTNFQLTSAGNEKKWFLAEPSGPTSHRLGC